MASISGELISRADMSIQSRNSSSLPAQKGYVLEGVEYFITVMGMLLYYLT